MKCVTKDVEEIVYGPRDEEQEDELVDALNKWPTGDLYALCVGCSCALCKQCMGLDKYFPNAVEVDTESCGNSKRTGFLVKPASEFRYFVCHDCVYDKENYGRQLLLVFAA